jgi:putative addiction module CopG family antidote
MRTTRQLSVTLTLKMADMVREKVASGEYASESEVLRDGLRALAEREAAVERWLRNEVVPAFDGYVANPSAAVPLDEAFDTVLAQLRARSDAKRA